MLKNLINYFSKKPKTLFLIDSIGAFLTTFFLFVVIRQFNEYFGIPKTELTYLSLLGICFCIYSTSCFLFLKRNHKHFIRIIATANLLYCFLTIGLMIKYYSSLTIIGVAYFFVEIIIILGLSYIELKVANINKSS
jgi:hypothetical protein